MGRRGSGQPLRASWPLHSDAGREANAFAWAAIAGARGRSALGLVATGIAFEDHAEASRMLSHRLSSVLVLIVV